MELDHDQDVAVDERPLVRPLTGNRQLPSDQEWDEKDEDDEELDGGETVIAAEDDTAEAEPEEDDADEDDGFADDERDPFVRAPAALVPAAETDSEEDAGGEPVETRSPVTLDGAVYARIADCLRAAITAADEKLGPARELAEREPFYTGYVSVLEAQRRRYLRALDRVLLQAESAAVAPADVDDVEVETFTLV